MSVATLTHQFVGAIPQRPRTGTLYVSIEYGTAMHLCCCGCQREVVTPITPNDWILSYDGAAVSLSPSIGNWSFECRSHYFITNNRVRWAATWSDDQITKARDDRSPPRHRDKPSNPSTDGLSGSVISRLRAALSSLFRGGE